MKQGIRSFRFDFPTLEGAWPVLWISSIYVAPENRGKMVAREMLLELLEANPQCHTILEAHPFGPEPPLDAAQLTRFYRSFGFRRIRGFPINLMYKRPKGEDSR
jgi:GNAT superfamily N-acetyltransferase